MSDTLIVFVKQPRPGAVKTRIAREAGAEQAARIYAALAAAEIRATAPLDGSYERVFYFAPATAGAEVAAWLAPLVHDPAPVCRAQVGADLGERMARAFDECFAAGARRVAIIGSDVPDCTRAHVHSAFAALDAHDVVLGPTHDGGYYLLALARPRPELFRDVAWSTPAVCATTLQRAHGLGLRVARLAALRDVDTLADWQALGQRVEDDCDGPS